MKFPKQRHHRRRLKPWTTREERNKQTAIPDFHAYEAQAAKYRRKRKRLARVNK